MATCATCVPRLYKGIIEEVIASVRENFLDEGIDEQVLTDLKQQWEAKLAATKATDQSDVNHALPSQPHSQPGQNSQSQMQNQNNIAVQNMALVPVQITVPSQQAGGVSKTITIHVPSTALSTGIAGPQLQSILSAPAAAQTFALEASQAAEIIQRQLNNALIQNGVALPPQLLQFNQRSQVDGPVEGPIESLENVTERINLSLPSEAAPSVRPRTSRIKKLKTRKTRDAKREANKQHFPHAQVKDNVESERSGLIFTQGDVVIDDITKKHRFPHAQVKDDVESNLSGSIFNQGAEEPHEGLFEENTNEDGEEVSVPKDTGCDILEGLKVTVDATILDEIIEGKLKLSQVDGGCGLDDSSDEISDDDDDDDEEDEKEEDKKPLGDDEEQEEEEQDDFNEDPLNSDDDVSDNEVGGDIFETDNVVVCQYDKITRVRNKWKFHLKDGIMNLKTKDYIFTKASGEGEW